MTKKYVIMLDGERFFTLHSEWGTFSDCDSYTTDLLFSKIYSSLDTAISARDVARHLTYKRVNGEKVEPSRIAIYEINYNKMEV